MNVFNMKRNILSSKSLSLSYKLSLLKNSKKNYQGYYFTVQPNTSTILNGKNVLVYQAPEYNEMLEILNKNEYFSIIPKGSDNISKLETIWENCVMSTNFKAKYFSLIPFFLEDRHTLKATKKFVLNMELFPESKHLRLTIAMLGGMYHILFRFLFFYI